MGHCGRLARQRIWHAREYEKVKTLLARGKSRARPAETCAAIHRPDRPRITNVSPAFASFPKAFPAHEPSHPPRVTSQQFHQNPVPRASPAPAGRN